MSIKKETDEIRNIRTGFLIWVLIWIINKSIIHLAFLTLPESSFPATDLLIKALNFILSIALMIYVIRNWNWNLNDWGFTYDFGFWMTFVVTAGYVGYFWYVEGMPADFSTQTLRQALTGVWEELISTVFLTALLIKYFRTLPKLNTLMVNTLAVGISALLFTLLHYGEWTQNEIIGNTISFIVYRVIYAFVGTSFFGIAVHGVSNGNYMAFPFLLTFYFAIAFLNRRTKK